MLARRPYATDLSDDEWKILEPLVPEAKPGGRPRAHQPRELLNAIFYVLSGEDAPGASYPTTSCPGKLSTTTLERGASLPCAIGTWERIHATLRERLRR